MEIRQVALVININHYQILSSLPTPTFDRQKISQYLQDYGNFQVQFLPASDNNLEIQVNASPKTVSRKDLEKAIFNLFHPPGDRVPQKALLYFTGHGLRKNKGIIEEFLATSDSNPAQGNWGISFHWLQKVLATSPIPQKIVWLDCFYGEELVFDFDDLMPQTHSGYSLMTTRRGFKVTKEGIDVNDNHFVQAILEGLNPFNHLEKSVSAIALSHFVADYLREYQQQVKYFNLGEPITLTQKPDTVAVSPTQSSRQNLVCPYPGLNAFQIEDAPNFYGRNELIAQLLYNIRQSNFVALVGNSGTGKSSLLRAGLMANLQSGNAFSDSKNWDIRIFNPGDRPLMNLVWTISNTNLPHTERARQLNQLQNLVQQGSKGFQKLLELFYPNRLILIIDQFEELFTLCQSSLEQATFLDCLLGTLESAIKAKFVLVLAIRADFLEKCLEQPDSRLVYYLQNHLVMITPMTKKSLHEIILKPLKEIDLELNTDLVEEILKDINYSSSSLPLLQYTLRKLWRQENDLGLQIPAYRLLGGVNNSLDQQATIAYQQLSELEQETAQYIFLALIQFNEGSNPIARGVINRELVTPLYSLALIDLVVQKLVHEQLIKTEPMPLSKGELDDPVILNLAHEVLIQHWQLLQQWLKTRQDYLRQKQELEAQAKQWQNSTAENQKQYLLSGRALTEIKTFQQTQRDRFPLPQVVEVFIQASSQNQRDNRLKLGFLIGLIPLIGLIFGGWKLYQSSQDQRHWQIITENQGKRESLPRIKALEALNKTGVSLSQQRLNGLNLQKIDLTKADLSNSNLTDSFLTGANLTNANLKKADLSQTEFTGANLTGANFSDSQLKNSYLTGASFERGNLTNANLSGANLMRISLAGAMLQGVNLSQAELTGAKITEVDLSKANLTGANFWGADLTGADLTGANFNQANLTRVNFTGANLTKVILTNANLTTTDFSSANNIPLEQIKSACFWEKAIFTDDLKQKLATIPVVKTVNCQQWIAK